MLELFGWNVGMTLFEAIVLVLGAIIVGAIAQYIGRTVIGYEWIFAATGALVGGWLGSEAFGAVSTWGPAIDGLYLVPALIGGVFLGAVVDAVARLLTGGTYMEPRPVHTRPI
jgi:uncharacterized membrane protein YeaQ/YmgE (transglycosylase-associated protein family)